MGIERREFTREYKDEAFAGRWRAYSDDARIAELEEQLAESLLTYISVDFLNRELLVSRMAD
jgi:hypothetical protein